jgi:hypothetical protein
MKTYRITTKHVTTAIPGGAFWQVQIKQAVVHANSWFEARDKGCILFQTDRDHVEAVELSEPPAPSQPLDDKTPKPGSKTPKPGSKIPRKESRFSKHLKKM